MACFFGFLFVLSDPYTMHCEYDAYDSLIVSWVQTKLRRASRQADNSAFFFSLSVVALKAAGSEVRLCGSSSKL